MRLTQIKLAGFKSFVDPTAIHVPGTLVGVVGPNGCGKSNIIDAVRWVLGESRAAALRGESMQDVIFNGTSDREAVARCSVELSFDNALGKAAGIWSQYAEISVRRILQRDGESSYFINNTHVRRRDVQDIFLGTGLGPRAYAIIEQGMISRIIEARPEDLRVFLEEAAGISKYKERRRETEHRLADTRENLARVGDILQELTVQIEKLAQQAEVAGRYQKLCSERNQRQNLLALLRRNEARAEAERHARDVETAGVELQAQTAGLRQAELELDRARTEHYAAVDAVNSAQGLLYESNAEASRLESEIRFVGETRQRIDSQIAQAVGMREAGERRAAELRSAAEMWQARLAETRARIEAVRARLAAKAQELPRAEQADRQAQERLEARQFQIAQAEQSLQLEQAHAAHSRRIIEGLENRDERLRSERAELAAPEEALLARLEGELARSREELARQQQLQEQVETALANLEQERASAQDRLQSSERELAGLDAKRLTLQQIQRHTDELGQIDDWLERHGLAQAPRLWQRITVESGWETAVESVLRERLHALELGAPGALQELVADPPPARVTAYSQGLSGDARAAAGLAPLAGFVRVQDERLSGVIADWLGHCYAIEGIPDLETRLSIDPHAILVNREGHQFSRYGIGFHAPDPADSGILARRREIESLAVEVRWLRSLIQTRRTVLEEVSVRLEAHVQALGALRAAGDALRQRHHERQIEQVQRLQERERYLQRSAQIGAELAEIAEHKGTEAQAAAAAETAARRVADMLAGLREEFTEVSAQYAAVQRALQEARQALHQAQRDEQDAGFGERECLAKLGDIEEAQRGATVQSEQARQTMAALEDERAALRDEGLREALQQALEERSARETTLGRLRAAQDDIAARLRTAEESRLALSQGLQPISARIAELRLKEQAARLACDQHAAQLAESGADEAELAALLRQGQKAASLQAEITRLGNAIAELGAINMAAMDELETSRGRSEFLDAQARDLTEALEILESAIRRIDRETRELLQATFNAVNGHFGQLFPALFGGGDARLEMSGEEILDCGVQVIARPPGKKNTSIHLLSGGEKALTAIALVFSMFQLNPAPFCLLDEVDAPLDDANTERFCDLVKRMAEQTQFLFISHNKLTMEMAGQLIGVTMREQGVSRVVAVDIEEALRLREPLAA
ncbi:MAG: chromosome segregation protein SMC [Burkholderiales bacterium]|nr:chromosome segregation protein SMC [Burkholderiales bacterium]